METLKQTIKTLAKEQLGLKNQRKSVKIVGERTLTPYEAWKKHQINRIDLRHLNIAYGLLRGQDILLIENNPKEPFHQAVIDRVMDKYKDNIK